MNKPNRRKFLKKSSAAAVGATTIKLTNDGIAEEIGSKEGVFKLGDFELQSGTVFKDAFLSYETHGKLNQDRSNAILYPTWYTGRHMDNRAAI